MVIIFDGKKRQKEILNSIKPKIGYARKSL
jgi:hypothetical protein